MPRRYRIRNPELNRQWWINFLSSNESDVDWKEAYTQAVDWRKCACSTVGNVVRQFFNPDEQPEVNAGIPEDNLLRSLGHDFFGAIKGRQMAWARVVFNRVQERAKELGSKNAEEVIF